MSDNGTIDVLKVVWDISGGWRRISRAWYTWAALLISVLCWSLWWDAAWWDLSLEIIPGMLGFSLAGFAMMLAFGDDRFRAVLSRAMVVTGGEGTSKHSAFMGYASIFVHYLVAQVLGLLLAIIAKAELGILPLVGGTGIFRFAIGICHFVGFFFVVYSILMALAATLAVFRMARTADKIQRLPPPKPDAVSPEGEMSHPASGPVVPASAALTPPVTRA